MYSLYNKCRDTYEYTHECQLIISTMCGISLHLKIARCLIPELICCARMGVCARAFVCACLCVHVCLCVGVAGSVSTCNACRKYV